MSDPYAAPNTELRDPAVVELSPFSAERNRTGRIFGTLNLILGIYIGQALLRVVIPGLEAAWEGSFSWDLALYTALLLLPALLLVKGTLELVTPGLLAALWRRRKAMRASR